MFNGEPNMRAFEHLISYALAKGCKVNVDGSAVFSVEEGVEYVEAVDEADVTIFHETGRKIVTAIVSAYGLDDEETVMDYSGSDWFQTWNNVYDSQTDWS
jgi:hypothetical protein